MPTKPEAISLLDRHLQPEHLEPGNVQKNSRDSCTTLLHMLVYIVDLQTTLITISICNILFCTSELPFRLFDGGQCVLYRTPRQILYRTSSAFDLRIVHIYRFNTENICVPFFWRKARRFPSWRVGFIRRVTVHVGFRSCSVWKFCEKHVRAAILEPKHGKLSIGIGPNWWGLVKGLPRHLLRWHIWRF